MIQALCIYGGLDRHKLDEQILEGKEPDNSFFGWNHVQRDPRINTEYLQITKEMYGFGGGMIRKFEWLNVLYLFFALRRTLLGFDVVMLASSAHLYLMLLKRIGLFRRQKFMFLNIDLNIRLKHAEGKPLRKFFLLQALRGAERIVCISKEQIKVLESCGISDAQLEFVHFGIDKRFYKTLASKSFEIILTIGRDAGRDLRSFMKAMEILGHKAVVICSPKNTEGMLDAIPPNVTVLYDRSYAEMQLYFNRALCFVVASVPDSKPVGSDCSGQTTILESMGYGVPVIATHKDWMDGYFTNKEHLIMVEPGNPEALAETVRELIFNREYTQAMTSAAKDLIDTKYNTESMGREISRIIRELASERV